MTRKEQLKADLLKNFSDFQKIDPNVAPGGSDAANSIVAEGLADSIDRAIDDGIDLTFKGILRCSEINLLTDKKSGDLYTCADAGVLNGSVQLPVTKTSVVLWTGDRFKLFLVVPEQVTPGSQISIDGFFSQTSRNPVENRLVTAALAATINAINLHVQNQENPHNVTAEQVGAISATALDEAIESEATARANADTDLGNRINEEASDRQQADIDLQSQIDSITSKSDVVDVVDSYSELLAYDTSELGDNDVVKVLEDETHDNAESYYRWNITTETWGYIGSQGPFVTPAEMQTALNGKVDKVNGKGLSTNDFTDAAKAVTDNIFLATYNSTSYADIKAAYDSGKTILCRFTDSSHTVRVATFDRLTNSTTSTSYAYFASVTKADAYELVASKTRYGTTTSWSNTQKTWGALAEKDSVTNADISGTIQDAHIASASTWNGKQDAISDLSTIISNASNGQTSYGWGNHATWTPSFSQATSRENLNGSGETIATILGKIMKWFADLGSDSLAWISKITTGSDSKVLSQRGNWVNLPSTGMSTDGSNASDAAIRNLINKSTSATNIGSDEYFVTVKSSGQWKYTMATLKSYALDGPANSVKDTGATSKNINVRWEGSSVGSNFKHFACFRTKDGGDSNTSATICDIPITEARKQMLGSSIGDSNTPVRLDSNGVLQPCSMSNYVKKNIENTITTSGGIGLTCQDDVDARIRALETGNSARYIQLDVESDSQGGNVAVYGRNGQSNGSYILSIDASTVNSGGRGVCGLGHSTDTLVRLGTKKLDFSGTFGNVTNTIYFM